mgnify:CR=1 FL=1
MLAGLLNWAMSYVQTYLTGWVGERILADLRIAALPPSPAALPSVSTSAPARGVIISRLTNDVEAIDQLVTDGVTSLVQNSLTLIGTAILLFVLDWRLALATLAVIPLMSIATVIFRVRSTRAYRAVRERLGLVTATLAEDIAGMRVVQAFTREQREHAELQGRHRALPRLEHGDRRPERPLLPLRRPPPRRSRLAVVLGYGGHLYFNGDVTLGTLFAFMLYVQNFFDPVQQLSQLYNTFLSGDGGARQDHGRHGRGAGGSRPAGRAAAAAGGRPRRLRRTSASGTATGPRCCTSSTLERPCRNDRRARRAHGRRQVDDRQARSPGSTTRATAGSRSTATTCAT